MTFASSGSAFTNGFNAKGINCGIAEALTAITDCCATCRAEHKGSRNVRDAYARYAVESCVLGKCISKAPPEDYSLLPSEVKDLDTGKTYKVYTVVVEGK